MITWDNFKPEAEKAMRARKIDGNQTKVVEALRKAGLSVAITSSLGSGFPDLVVGGSPRLGRATYPQKTILVELKDPSRPISARKLSSDEFTFHSEWKGEAYVCETAEEILKIFGLI